MQAMRSWSERDPVAWVLGRNQGNLEGALRGLASFVVTSGDALGSGRWFDGYLQNLVPVPVSVAKGTR
jgi:phospholipid/cholesterol/gamma-HCH transport system substrate-binding protein